MPDPTPDPLQPLIQRWLQSDDPDTLLEQLCREHPEHADALRERLGEQDATHYSDVPAAAPSQHPEQVGPYRILDTLGEGGMGTVYLAEQREPVRRRVALKLIKLGMDTLAVVRRFEQERQALALMDHEGIAKVYDVGTSERGQPFFVMELVKGVPLDTFCERNRLSLHKRLQLMQQVCSAVQHAHQKGVLHRDLKPGNVLVSDLDGRLQIKIIDFGLAKAMGQKLIQESLFTEMGVVMGTPEFMAPEQADPTNLDVDTRADVYALGVMLYQLLVGELPFSGKELRQAGLMEMQRVLREVEPPKPSTKLTSIGERSSTLAGQLRVSVGALKKALTSDLDWVVVKALEKDRNRRYQSATALAEDLQRYLDHEPLEAGPPSAAYRLQKMLRRHRASVLAAGLVLAALVLGGVMTYVQWRRADQQATENLTLAQANDKIAREKSALAASETAAKEAAEAALAEREAALEKEQQSRAAAVAAAERAERTLTFLEEVIVQASPDEAPRPDLTVRELFTQVAAGLVEDLSSEPVVQVRLLQTVADVFYAIDQFEDGRAARRQALSIHEAAGLPDDLAKAQLLADLADMIELDDESVETANAMLEQSLEILDGLGEVGADYAVFVRGTVSKLEVWKAEQDASRESVADDQLTSFAKVLNFVFKRDESELDRTRHELLDLIAVVEAGWKAGERDETLARLRAEFDRFPAIRNKFTAPMVFTAIQRFAIWAREKGRLDLAEAVLRAKLQIAEEVLGDRHSVVRVFRVRLADLLVHLGQLEDAARLLRQVIPIAAMQDEGAADQLMLYARLIRAELQQDPKADVADLLVQMAALAPAAREDPYIWGWLHGAVMEEFVNADRDASELFLLFTAILGEPERAAGEPVLAGSLRVGLAELLAGQGRFEEAEAQMLAVWEAVEADGQIAASDRAGLARRIARIYHVWNKQEETARWAQRAAGR